ncbi:MAG TPA: ABC transporter permease [Syntrophobacteria bacterium]|nr:ABC transporter permease [Syntrophobacteria bacterium]
MASANGVKRFWKEVRESSSFNIAVVLAVLCLVASTFSKYFLDFYNLQSLIRDLAFLGLITLGQAILLILGEIDLSLGKISALCGVLAGIFMVQLGINPYLSILLCLALGFVFGLLNGLLVTKLRLNSLVVTIGMSGVFGGFNLVFTHGEAITDIPKSIYFLGQGYILKVPTPFIIMFATAILVILYARYTKGGRYIYAIGNSKEASLILGIKVDLIKTLAFAFAGLLASAAGILMVARLGTSQPGIGESWPLNSIAGSVIGGISLTGGVGEPLGALLGIGVIIVIQNMIVLFGVSPYWQTVVSGVIVVVAIAIGSISAMVSERRVRKAVMAKGTAGVT